MLRDEPNQQYLETLRVPDWIQLFVKLSTMIPNRSWQTFLNFLNIGHTGVSVFPCSHLLPMYPLVTVVHNNNNFILMLYLDCEWVGGGR